MQRKRKVFSCQMMMEKLLSALLLVCFLPSGLFHVVTKFSDVPECESFFMDKVTPNLPGVLVYGDVKDQNRYKPICQLFKCQKNGKMIHTFATLYDTTNRIPVFSAYKFTGVGSRGDRTKWVIEPQLEKEDAAPDMQLQIDGEAYAHQAVNGDYDCDGPSKGVNREAKLNDRVNIPSYLWSAYCCFNSNKKEWMATAYWSPNDEEGGKNLMPITLNDLYKELEVFYPDDTVKVRIPVFSAYTYTGKVAGRPTHPWMIEPQLEDGNADQSMNTSEKDVQYEHQAGNIDFNNSIVVKGVNRGHLFPCSHAPDNDTKMSTFTLTNVVPQAESFNGGSWNQMECRVRDLLQNQCVDNNNMTRAYVVTGAVASQNNTLNNRVNIPSVMWTAYCCYNSMTREWMAQAHWGNNTHTTGRDLPSETLGALYDMLSLYNQTGVQMFPEKQQDPGVLSLQVHRYWRKEPNLIPQASDHDYKSSQSVPACQSSRSVISFLRQSSQSVPACQSSRSVISFLRQSSQSGTACQSSQSGTACQSSQSVTACQSSQSVTACQSSQSVTACQSSQSVLACQSSQSVLACQSSQSVLACQSSQSVLACQSSQSVLACQSSQSVLACQSSQSVLACQSSQSVLACQSSQSVLACQSSQSVLACQSSQSVLACQSSQSVLACQSSQSVTACQSSQSVTACQSSQSVTACQSSQSVTACQSSQSVTACQISQSVTACQSSQSVTACQSSQSVTA
ncbi:hypothetical protein DPEC_G00105720 [Dallia pectoralis]|uniref:Uncharacterized protein n=1 Tax=Dallia pectoralis TaxID=75939 RepID=A0ACC2GXL1_DALPE|nr:hypothetical protein DPEC_G00105720 [Dallia pectoralis]